MPQIKVKYPLPQEEVKVVTEAVAVDPAPYRPRLHLDLTEEAVKGLSMGQELKIQVRGELTEIGKWGEGDFHISLEMDEVILDVSDEQEQFFEEED